MTGRRGRRKVCVGDRARRESTGGAGRPPPCRAGGAPASSPPPAVPPAAGCSPLAASPRFTSRDGFCDELSVVWRRIAPGTRGPGDHCAHPGATASVGSQSPGRRGGPGPPCPPCPPAVPAPGGVDWPLLRDGPTHARVASACRVSKPFGIPLPHPRPRPLGSSRADPCSGTRPSFCFEGVKTKAAAGGGGRAPPRQQLGVGGAGGAPPLALRPLPGARLPVGKRMRGPRADMFPKLHARAKTKVTWVE